MAKSPNLLSEVRFGAFLVYSPRGTSESSRRSRDWRDGIKFDRPGWIRGAARGLAEALVQTELLSVLGPQVVLIPAPRSAPHVPGVLWPARRLCEELMSEGLGNTVLECLARERPVRKSAFAPRGTRPTAQEHLDSMTTRPVLAHPERITVVDDFITKGATLLASASLVQEMFPEAEVATFAMIRTMGFEPEIADVVSPCLGRVHLDAWGGARRDP